MVERGPGPSDRSVDHEEARRRRRLTVRRPLGWPRYMVERRLSDGSIAYYWRVRARDRAAGFPIDSEVLGADYVTAIDRAKTLNAHYDSWRQGRHLVKDLDQNPRFGSVGWLFEHYRQSRAFERVSERSRPGYLRALRRIEDLPTRTGAKLAELAVASIS